MKRTKTHKTMIMTTKRWRSRPILSRIKWEFISWILILMGKLLIRDFRMHRSSRGEISTMINTLRNRHSIMQSIFFMMSLCMRGNKFSISIIIKAILEDA